VPDFEWYGDGVPGVRHGQFRGERIGDDARAAELVDRGRNGPVLGKPGSGVVVDGVVEAVAQLGEDPLAPPSRPGQVGGDVAQVRRERRHGPGGVHVMAGRAGPTSSAVTAAENCSQTTRCSLSAARPAGVR